VILDKIELIAFQELSEENKLLILNWRNHDNVRKWMYNSETILSENHFKFIESLKTSTTNKYFLVMEDEKKIGVIYFTDIDNLKKKAEFGLYANPDIKGVGKLLMDIICDYAFEKMSYNKLIAEVFDSNKRAIDLYINKNFKPVQTKIVDKRKIICMELIK